MLEDGKRYESDRALSSTHAGSTQDSRHHSFVVGNIGRTAPLC
jgi:hypothetical protein